MPVLNVESKPGPGPGFFSCARFSRSFASPSANRPPVLAEPNLQPEFRIRNGPEITSRMGGSPFSRRACPPRASRRASPPAKWGTNFGPVPKPLRCAVSPRLRRGRSAVEINRARFARQHPRFDDHRPQIARHHRPTPAPHPRRSRGLMAYPKRRFTESGSGKTDAQSPDELHFFGFIRGRPVSNLSSLAIIASSFSRVFTGMPCSVESVSSKSFRNVSSSGSKPAVLMSSGRSFFR